jgi:tetraacyldisaccharide 4'-kinase
MKVFLPMSWVFGVAVWVRNFLFDNGLLPVRKLPGTVISVGNIAVGGTGKTPIVIELAKKIISKDGTPAIVTRGYKSGLGHREWQVLRDGNVIAGVSRSNVIADEARMQSKALKGIPVVVGARRFHAVRSFLREAHDVNISHWILDDGFQHRQIYREVDIVVVDVRNPSGNLLPVDYFREDFTAIKRADMVILTKAATDSQIKDSEQKIKVISPNCPVYVADFEQGDLKLVCGDVGKPEKRYALISSIANPDDVIEALEKVGINPAKLFLYRDHMSFREDEVMSQRLGFDCVVTTEKDWARDEMSFRRLGVPVYVASVVLKWRGPAPDISV